MSTVEIRFQPVDMRNSSFEFHPRYRFRRQLVEDHDQGAQRIAMPRDDHPMPAEHLGQNFLTIIGENAGHRVLQAFPAGRPDVVGAAPEIHLFVAIFPDGIVFIHAAKDPIMALIEGSDRE